MTMKVEDAFEILDATGYVEAVSAVRDELEFTRKQRDLAQQALAVNERHEPVSAREYAEATFRVTDFSRACATDLHGAGSFRFGLSGPRTAAALRELAAAFDAGRLLPQEATAAEVARVDDFTMVTLTLTLADRYKDATPPSAP